VRCEWDDAKSSRNYAARGFDFEFASRIFAGRTVEVDDKRCDYGERRIKAIGQVDGFILVVIYTWRGEHRRIISARVANQRERHGYHQKVAVSDRG
jgi:uncharacterized DUF497 family protein